MTTRYAVVVKAISEHPWIESLEDTYGYALDKKQFIEAHLRGVRVSIEKVEWEEER